jgi:hypothetical protein
LEKQAKHFPIEPPVRADQSVNDRPCLKEATLAPGNGAADGEKLVVQVTNQLTPDFGANFSKEVIQGFVAESLESLGKARVQTYLPLLIHRPARQRLIAASSGLKRDNESRDP